MTAQRLGGSDSAVNVQQLTNNPLLLQPNARDLLTWNQTLYNSTGTIVDVPNCNYTDLSGSAAAARPSTSVVLGLTLLAAVALGRGLLTTAGMRRHA